MTILQAAEEWGCPPWEIANGKGTLTWFMRWQAYAAERNRAMRDIQSG